MKGEAAARGKIFNIIVINWLCFVGVILENELAGNGVGRDSIAPDKCTLSVYRTAANIAG